MPKADQRPKRSSRRKSPNLEPITLELKMEDTEPELVTAKSSSSGTTETGYQLTQAVHFDELNNLWPADIRIPSVKSRKAWAIARNLNPANIHSWWYRRKRVAKKLRIKIPLETYELEVGSPPVIPVLKAMAVKEEEEEESVAKKTPEEPASAQTPLSSRATDHISDTPGCGERSVDNRTSDQDTFFGKKPAITPSDAHIPASDADWGDSLALDSSGTTLVDDLEHSLMQSGYEAGDKSAYIHESSLEVLSPRPIRPLYLQFSCESSPLPPSSPPASSPSPALVSSVVDQSATVEDERSAISSAPIHEDFLHPLTFTRTHSDRESLWESFALLEAAGYYPTHLLPLTSYQRIPMSACASTPVLDICMLEAHDRGAGSLAENGARSSSPINADTLLSSSPSSSESDSKPCPELYLRTLTVNPEDAPWCLDGFRISCDGSLVGLCSCYYNSPTARL